MMRSTKEKAGIKVYHHPLKFKVSVAWQSLGLDSPPVFIVIDTYGDRKNIYNIMSVCGTAEQNPM